MGIPKKSDSIITGQDLLLLIEQRDTEAFTGFYIDNFKKLILVSDKYVREIPVAEEIVQNIFLRIWEDKQLLTDISSIKSYLYRSVINASINHVNRERSLEKHHLKIAESLSEEDLDRMDEQNELIVLLYREIELLPEKCREVFKLSRLEGIKYKAIALQLGISEKTVENHMGHALKVLRDRILHQAKGATPMTKVKYLSILGTFLC
ncbi:RNA polymerase sigma-70 factor [Pedobacter africanus]|uniref:RNA polymerase sigma-70 factor, ECF subfamily n=1 Tax=Pedobacter africanus TaxID=151894 RepID=A0A1W2B287_9SPHI|nr:RNA polymerase sigma-70 factor [Pedobacter africanus]SMC66954.1 RNA polymerase sigma-70 factor, ECF subfamily [Pedobacter africanus]